MQINLWSKIVCISWKENSNNKKKEYYKERTKVNANINNIVKTEKEKKGIWIWIWMKRNRSKKKYVYKKIRKRDERKNQSDWKGKWRNGEKEILPIRRLISLPFWWFSPAPFPRCDRCVHILHRALRGHLRVMFHSGLPQTWTRSPQNALSLQHTLNAHTHLHDVREAVWWWLW